MFANASDEVVLINFAVIFQFSRRKACKALAMNQFLLMAIAVIGSAQEANSVVYLRPKNDRGPSTCRNCLNLQRTVTITYNSLPSCNTSGCRLPGTDRATVFQESVLGTGAEPRRLPLEEDVKPSDGNRDRIFVRPSRPSDEPGRRRRKVKRCVTSREINKNFCFPPFV